MAVTPRRIIKVKEAQPPKAKNTDAGSVARNDNWTQQLAGEVSVTLDANGNGIAFMGPLLAREYWELTQANVSVRTAVLEARCLVSQGVGGTAVQTLDNTRAGSSGDTIGFGSLILDGGGTVIAQWFAGDANAMATLKLYGIRRRYGGE